MKNSGYHNGILGEGSRWESLILLILAFVVVGSLVIAAVALSVGRI